MVTYLKQARKAMDFKGRTSRREYWTLVIQVQLLAMMVVWALVSLGVDRSIMISIRPIITFIVSIPMIAAGARRLHDTNTSGWFILVNWVIWFSFVSSIGKWFVVRYPLVMLVGLPITIITLLPSQQERDKYGECPK